MGGAAHAVAGGEEAGDGGHAVVAPEVLRGGDFLRPADPGAAGGGVGAHEVGLGEDDLGGGLGRVDVLGGPEEGLDMVMSRKSSQASISISRTRLGS